MLPSPPYTLCPVPQGKLDEAAPLFASAAARGPQPAAEDSAAADESEAPQGLVEAVSSLGLLVAEQVRLGEAASLFEAERGEAAPEGSLAGAMLSALAQLQGEAAQPEAEAAPPMPSWMSSHLETALPPQPSPGMLANQVAAFPCLISSVSPRSYQDSGPSPRVSPPQVLSALLPMAEADAAARRAGVTAAPAFPMAAHAAAQAAADAAASARQAAAEAAANGATRGAVAAANMAAALAASDASTTLDTLPPPPSAAPEALTTLISSAIRAAPALAPAPAVPPVQHPSSGGDSTDDQLNPGVKQIHESVTVAAPECRLNRADIAMPACPCLAARHYSHACDASALCL